MSAIQFDGNSAIKALARRAKIPEHAFHYSLKRLQSNAIVRRGVLLNLRLMGFEQYEVYFSLAATRTNSRKELLRNLRSHPSIFWVAELGGDYQYGMSICVRHASQVCDLLEHLARQYGCIFSKKSLATIISYTQFRKKYLAPENSARRGDSVTLPRGAPQTLCDATDLTILGALNGPEGGSSYELSRKTGIPRTTIEYRLRRLEENNIILKHIYFISAAKLGMLTFKLLIFARGVQPELSENLFRFSREEKSAVILIHCLGSWDYEVVAEVAAHSEIIQLVESLYAAFSESINDIQILPVFQQTTSSGFLHARAK